MSIWSVASMATICQPLLGEWSRASHSTRYLTLVSYSHFTQRETESQRSEES